MEAKIEQTRIRINFSVTAKGVFQPDITSEPDTVATAMANLDEANTQLNNWALTKGISKEEVING